MGMLCRTKKLSQHISYIMIRTDDLNYQISLSIYKDTYETTLSSVSRADKWVRQQVEDNMPRYNEID